MPRRIPYRLQWSSPEQKYTIFHDERPLTPRIELAGQGWVSWLETISSFSFQSRSGGSCTVRKENVQRGGTYWYAYRRQQHRMVKRYLARSADLTLARLEAVTAALNDLEAPSRSAMFTDMESEAEPSLEQKEIYTTPSAEIAPPSPLLLTTRLHIPRPPVQHVSRPRLLALLQQGIQKPLTLVSAPAGSGKTTLLAEWATTTDLSVAWLSLETADNDPARFLAYLLAALAGLDTCLETAIQAHQFTNTQDSEHALTSVLNDLTRLLQQDVVLILDDYHVLTTESIHNLLRFLLDHLPPRLHLIIGTRVDPPLPLARLRARNQVSELRTTELRFLSSEVEALIRAMGLMLSEEATSLLEQRTEGWIAGIQLLALALRRQSDAAAFLQLSGGTHSFLLDYVSEEILAQQTPETRRFLLLTCVLKRMTGQICDAVTELPDGQTRLAELLRANLFVSALDATESWYRYHTLFANALRTRLQKQEPELIPQLYLRASYWYEQQQDREEACDYAFLAGDLPRAANLTARLLPHMVEQGRFERLRSWLSQLPPDLIAASPQLYVTVPWLHSVGKHTPENAEQVLQRMEEYVMGQHQDTSASWAEPQSVLTLFRAITALEQNKPLRAFKLAREALRTLTARETDLSQLLTRFLQIILSLTYGARGNLAQAERILLDLSASRSAESLSLTIAATFLLGELYKAQGQLRKLGALYEGVLQAVGSHPNLAPMPLLLQGFILMRRASLLYEWNRLPEAADTMQQVLAILPRAEIEIIIPKRSSLRPSLAFGLRVQAHIELAQGQPEAARHFLELVRCQPAIYGELPSGKERPPVDVPMLAARLALACGQIEEAERWEQTCDISIEDAPVTLLESRQVFAYLTLARILIARGRAHRADAALSQALILLDHWRDCGLRLGFQGWFIEVQMLTALALQAQGKTRQALTTLGPILAQAEQEGYVRLFADEGQPMAHLLTQISAYTTASPGYIRRIQIAIASTKTPHSDHVQSGVAHVSHAPHALIDPLSTRELEVLALLAQGLSNQQIADRLVISLNTAKRHVKHILARLTATNRTQAVARARELHLL